MMTGELEESSRRVPVLDRVDVLVAGGGPAGIAAALSAARAGARTMLVERYGYLGGMVTGAGVTAILGVGDGNRPKIKGVTRDIRQRLEQMDAVTPLNEAGDYRVDLESFKWQSTEMLIEAGATVLLHTMACAPVLTSGVVGGAFLESKSGREAVVAKITVDATADADLAYRAGCRCYDQTHDVTLGVKITGVDEERATAFAANEPDAYSEICRQVASLNSGVMLGKTVLLRNVDISDARHLTDAEIQLRRQYFSALMHLKKHMPGYERAGIALTQPQIGIRQGRRIRGVYTLTEKDILENSRFEDSIGRFGAYLPDYGSSYQIQGLDYDVPYRCLIPESVTGMLVAGRCISCDYTACNTLRLIAPCFATGQAAGVAAAICALSRLPIRETPVSELRATLLDQGANLG